MLHSADGSFQYERQKDETRVKGHVALRWSAVPLAIVVFATLYWNYTHRQVPVETKSAANPVKAAAPNRNRKPVYTMWVVSIGDQTVSPDARIVFGDRAIQTRGRLRVSRRGAECALAGRSRGVHVPTGSVQSRHDAGVGANDAASRFGRSRISSGTGRYYRLRDLRAGTTVAADTPMRRCS
jgi:hypothetical protein